MLIDMATLKRAKEIYLDWFCTDMDLDFGQQLDVLICENWNDFEALQDDLSAGQWDAIDAALTERRMSR